MLQRIKSSYFVEIIFNFIVEKRKLKIVQQNKIIQNILNININYYKLFKGTYFKFLLNGKRQEYDSYNDKIVFEGEYLNNQRNGKGKEFYYSSNIEFEGEYRNGKRNGYGKEYYKNGKLKFEGTYLNGNKWNGKGYDVNSKLVYELENGNGIVKEYYDNNILSFEGNYSNGQKDGKGKEYDFNGKLSFDGEYLNDKRNGNGKEYDHLNEALIYDGVYLSGNRWDGKGYDSDGNEIYELKNGKGIIREYLSPGKLLYEYEYINGEKNGKGKEYNYFNGKLKFEVEYVNNKRNGKCKEYDNDGNLVFEGQYLYDQKFKGREYVQGVLEYEGEYLFEKKWNGKGYDRNGNMIYELKNGSGKVKEYENGKLSFEGKYLNGKKDGEGKEYDYDERTIYEGVFRNGKKWDGIETEYNFNDRCFMKNVYAEGEKITIKKN